MLLSSLADKFTTDVLKQYRSGPNARDSSKKKLIIVHIGKVNYL